MMATATTGHRKAAAGSRSHVQHLVVALFGLALAGCAVGPDYSAPTIALPAGWGGAKTAQAPKPANLAQWWRRLNDPVLNDLVEQAVQGNLDVATAKAKIREARAMQREAVGALFPSLTGSGSATRNQVSSNSGGATSSPATTSVYNQFQAGFDASWELDVFGANRRAVEAATYGTDAAEDELRATLVTLIGDVTSYYAEARGYQARSALARRTAASQRETAALTQKKFEAGSSSAVDAAKAVGEAATTEANIPTYEAAYAVDVHKLGVLLGREPAALSELLKRSAPIPAPRLPLPTGIPADVLTSRPDVRQAERQLAQYTAKVGQAEAALYPSVSLTGSLSTTALKVGDLGKTSSIGWSWGPSVSVPIFNGGQLRAAVEVAEAQRDQYFVAWRSSVLTALQDVENAIVSLAQERAKTRSLTEAARRYGEAAHLSRSLYDAGTQSFFDLLDAERSQYSAEDSLLQSRIAIATDYIALAKALGGGWDGAIDSARPEVIDVNIGPHIAASQPSGQDDPSASDARTANP
jgi:NodT family efflux transporter outer membrane factor (OMF) lipoprotein